MKKTIILAAALSVFSITATFAQTEAPAKPEKKERTERKGERPNPMADLNLTEEQGQKMKALNEEGRAKMEAVRNDASLNDDQKKAKMMELRKAQNEKRMAILTPEQKKKWDDKMKEGRAKPEKRD
ncbi:MAG: hypothetical protein BGN92_12345 [Sphingobacteriales bacterium 41-5]|nr:MAG: hypothetical protein BGN92_12345 [Sphingobacteriales bacterium 41-5]